MRNIKFFSPDCEEFELPMEDFMDEMKIARVEYGYIDSYYYDDTYDKTMIIGPRGMVRIDNSSVIFLNPESITENNIIETIVHETLHLVIWKFERKFDSELIVRSMLDELRSPSLININKYFRKA